MLRICPKLLLIGVQLFCIVFVIIEAVLDPDLREINHNEVNEEINETRIKSGMTVEENEVIFKYYNRNYKLGSRIFRNNVSREIANYWNRNTALKIITHGWLSSEKSFAVDGIKNAYVEKTTHNIITVDWSESASWKAYPLPAYMTYQVGGILARLIDELIEKDMITLSNVHVIGHSLGSHVAGAAGDQVNAGKIARITGLDPAGPAFEVIHYATHNVLDTNDAEFVDVIHTASGAAGYYSVLGHADFYPNGGTPIQPGCKESNTVSGIVSSFACSHGRAYAYFKDSILYPHSMKAYRCDTWDEFKNKSCDNHETVYMGDETPNTAKGVYYLRTRSTSPYGLETKEDDENEIVS